MHAAAPPGEEMISLAVASERRRGWIDISADLRVGRRPREVISTQPPFFS